MVIVQTPPAAPSAHPGTDAGVIEDARVRQRFHRRIGGVLVAAAVAAGLLVTGVAGGGGGGAGTGRPAGRQPSGSGPGSGHARASSGFPGAPSPQPYGYGVQTDACPLAPPN